MNGDTYIGWNASAQDHPTPTDKPKLYTDCNRTKPGCKIYCHGHESPAQPTPKPAEGELERLFRQAGLYREDSAAVDVLIGRINEKFEAALGAYEGKVEPDGTIVLDDVAKAQQCCTDCDLRAAQRKRLQGEEN